MDSISTSNLKADIAAVHNLTGSEKRNVKMTPEAVSNELEALSYSISHDLRAPLRAIQNNCEWLSTKHAANLGEKESSLLQQITRSSEQMEQLLDGLLAFSKVVKSEPKQSAIDMTAMVHDVIESLLENEDERSPIKIIVNPLLPAFGDALLIRQVWYNLLSNAFKYTRYTEQKEIEIDSSISDGEIVYSVRDNGVGFDMQYADRLFGVFHRLHETEEFEGIGVGLAIVKRIIQRHGGRVWAEGIVDNGARFYFSLPKTDKIN
jgi:light-regulated signal transduction histidine kinase (bacteriophytochrome)